MARLTDFIGAAQRSLDFALYDMRLSDPLKDPLRRRCTNGPRPACGFGFATTATSRYVPDMAAGQDPAPPGTGAIVQALGFPWRRIGGMKLMHDKFIVRDGAAVWTGSLNLTDDAFTLMENNVIEIDSPTLAAFYEEDFEQIWEKGKFREHRPHQDGSGDAQFRGPAGDRAGDVFARLRT